MRTRVILTVLTFAMLLSLSAAQQSTLQPGWVEVNYEELLNGREPTHSGEAVSGLLRRLAGRPDDLLSRILLDPVLEKYAFVLTDALDRLSPPKPGEAPWYEPAGLYRSGEAEPAWVELLRSRRYVVESNGQGNLRVCLPLPTGTDLAATEGKAGAEAAWKEHWSVLRHVFASEQARLSAGETDQVRTLEVQVHGYLHQPSRSVFRLTAPGINKKVTDTGPDPERPSIDFAAWNRFLASGRILEGGRILPDGSIRFLSSESERPATLLGGQLTLADMAVAYRAVFHGGLGDPYMSLDRGYTPQTTHVNYGGRLRDTRLGMVALLCDIRFKTFSVGMDIYSGKDVREKVRKALPGFMTHVERFGADPGGSGVMSQQTRLWFYPDTVDMTLSPQADVLVLRSVRMSAASERLNEAGLAAEEGRPDPPWTRATVKTVNQDYDTMAAMFPELTDLDQVVRLLSFFTWLRVAQAEGLPVPDLDALLAVELPSFPTPRRFPQMLAFNALPPAGGEGKAEVYGRLEVGAGLERLFSANGRPLPARLRYDRAVGRLDDGQEEDRLLLQEISRYDPDTLDDASLDFYSYKAERIRMHRLVLSTLPMEQSRGLLTRVQDGEQFRMFSVGIGGLDLGMGKVFSKASSRSVGFGAAGRSSGEVRQAMISGDVTPFRAPETAPVPMRTLGDGNSRFEETMATDLQPGVRRLIQDAESLDVRNRTLTFSGDGTIRFGRYENGISLSYSMEKFDYELIARESATEPLPGQDSLEQATPPAGILAMQLHGGTDPSKLKVVIRNETGRSLAADFPRELFQQLVLGPHVDPRRRNTVPGLWPPSPQLGAVERVLMMQDRNRTLPPWEEPADPLPGEEDPLTVAMAMTRWSVANRAAGQEFPAVAVGTSANAAGRWASAPAPGEKPILLAPKAAFPGLAGAYAGSIRNAWKAGPVLDDLAKDAGGGLVMMVSAEPSGLMADRLRALARDPRMQDRALLVWSMGSGVREDLAASLLEEGRLATLGIIDVPPVDWRTVADNLAAISGSFGKEPPQRFDDLPVAALWFY